MYTVIQHFSTTFAPVVNNVNPLYVRLYHFVLSSYNQGRSYISKLGCTSSLPSSFPSSFPSSIPPSLLPCFPTLCLFLPFFISLRRCQRSFLNFSLPSSLSFIHSSLFFLFLSREPATRYLKPARGVRESCKHGRQTVSEHSEVKTGFW